MNTTTKAESILKPGRWWRDGVKEKAVCALRPRPGSFCPHCQQGKLDYDSLFNLSCPVCGRVAEAGAFT